MADAEKPISFWSGRDIISKFQKLSTECDKLINFISLNEDELQHEESAYKLRQTPLPKESLRSFLEKDMALSAIKKKSFRDYKSINEYTWSILSEIYLCEMDGTRVPIKRATLATGLPSTTALRWVCALEEELLIYRTQDHQDGRRQLLHLSNICRDKITEIFDLWLIYTVKLSAKSP